jgi:DNA mismatch repair protein MutL
MRSEATENYHLTNIVQHYALAHPEVAFTLTNNGREVLRLSPARDLRERAFQIFGAGLIESLLPVGGGREFVAQISGFVSAPRERRTTRDAQYFFINGRFVRDKIIAGGLLEGFRSILPHGVYPVAFLFLEIPHEEIDVNVHPAKTEVRFRRSEAVKEVIAEAIRGALAKAGILVDAEARRRGADAEIEAPRSEVQVPITTGEQAKIDFQFENQTSVINPRFAENEIIEKPELSEIAEAQNFEIPTSSEDFETAARERDGETERLGDGVTEAAGGSSWQLAESQLTKGEGQRTKGEDQDKIADYAVLPPVNSAEKIPKPVEPENLSRSKIRPIGQLHDSFIIAVDAEGMLLIDQHVAHERILFDKFRKKETERKIESQNLLLPETIDLTPAQSIAFSEIEEELENYGFGLMRLSGRTVAIKAIPTDLPPSEARNLLAEILETVDKEKRGHAKATWRDEIAASLACKAAVKINMKLTPEKMQWLIDRLLITSSPTTCPHGRPVILRLTMRDIERSFHRT